jgi:hypothetical protein
MDGAARPGKDAAAGLWTVACSTCGNCPQAYYVIKAAQEREALQREVC